MKHEHIGLIVYFKFNIADFLEKVKTPIIGDTFFSNVNYFSNGYSYLIISTYRLTDEDLSFTRSPETQQVF